MTSAETSTGLVFYSPKSDVQGISAAKGFLDQALSPERVLGFSRISNTATVIGSGVNQLMTYGMPWRLLAGLAGIFLASLVAVRKLKFLGLVLKKDHGKRKMASMFIAKEVLMAIIYPMPCKIFTPELAFKTKV